MILTSASNRGGGELREEALREVIRVFSVCISCDQTSEEEQLEWRRADLGSQFEGAVSPSRQRRQADGCEVTSHTASTVRKQR